MVMTIKPVGASREYQTRKRRPTACARCYLDIFRAGTVATMGMGYKNIKNACSPKYLFSMHWAGIWGCRFVFLYPGMLARTHAYTRRP